MKKYEPRIFEDITFNLSTNPNEREQQLYNRIIDFFNQFKTERVNETIWVGKTYIKLMKLLEKGDQFTVHSVLNSIILILALSTEKERNIDLLGIDVNDLSKHKKEQIRLILNDLFNEHLKNKAIKK